MMGMQFRWHAGRVGVSLRPGNPGGHDAAFPRAGSEALATAVCHWQIFAPT